MRLLKDIACWALVGVISIPLGLFVGGASAYWTLIYLVTYHPWY